MLGRIGKKVICFCMLVSFFGMSVVANIVPNTIDYRISSMNPKIIIVDDDGDGNYTTIQEALDAAEDGDQIHVYSGKYIENIHVSGWGNLHLQGHNEEWKNGTGIGYPEVDGSSLTSVVSIENCENVCFAGFNISNSSAFADSAGIFLKDCSNITLNNTAISNCEYGLYMDSIEIKGFCNIVYNTVSDCLMTGIIMYSCSLCWLQNNYIHDCGQNGILLANCRNNNIILNNISHNNRDPIKILSHPFTIQFGANQIITNTFIDNGEECEQIWSFFNHWESNYWNRSRYIKWIFIHPEPDYICFPPIRDLWCAKQPTC